MLYENFSTFTLEIKSTLVFSPGFKCRILNQTQRFLHYEMKFYEKNYPVSEQLYKITTDN